VGQPGTRAPHLWLEGEPKTSTLDLFHTGWTLLADDEAWRAAAHAASEQVGIRVTCLGLGSEVRVADGDAARAAFGLSKGGASLIRPDGIVAWRSPALPANPSQALRDALRRVASSVRRD
jgi:hypothetical protein